MLDRRTQPEPPRLPAAPDGDIFWVDPAGRVWHHIPLRLQLEQLRALRLRQARQAAGVCITAMCALAPLTAVVLSLLSYGDAGVVAGTLIVALIAIVMTVLAYVEDPVLEATDLRRELQQRWLAPLLVDSELDELLRARLHELYPNPALTASPAGIAGQLRDAAWFLHPLLTVRGMVERLSYARTAGIMLARAIGWVFCAGQPFAAALMVLTMPVFGLGLFWAVAALLSGPALRRSYIAEIALIDELLDETDAPPPG